MTVPNSLPSNVLFGILLIGASIFSMACDKPDPAVPARAPDQNTAHSTDTMTAVPTEDQAAEPDADPDPEPASDAEPSDASNTGDGDTFRITPLRPIAALREEALAASPPDEVGAFTASDLVELVDLDPTIRLDVRYATENNFMGSRMYTEARAFLQRPAAEALVAAHQNLREQGLGVIVYDGYRPWYVTKMFWEATPDSLRHFVAPPGSGSRHNRGCAVDLGLYDLATGAVLPMPSGYDEFSDRAYADYSGGTAAQRENRRILRAAMEQEGFSVYEYEWWHYDYKDWRDYRIQNKRFAEIDNE